METPPFLLPNELLRTAPPAAAFFRPGTMDMARANSLFAQHASSREGTRRFQRSQPRTPSRVRRRPPPPRASSCCPAAPCEEGRSLCGQLRARAVRSRARGAIGQRASGPHPSVCMCARERHLGLGGRKREDRLALRLVRVARAPRLVERLNPPGRQRRRNLRANRAEPCHGQHAAWGVERRASTERR